VIAVLATNSGIDGHLNPAPMSVTSHPAHGIILVDSRTGRIGYTPYPPDIRRLIYTTNTVESYNRQLRKVIKTKGAFPTSEGARKRRRSLRHAALVITEIPAPPLCLTLELGGDVPGFAGVLEPQSRVSYRCIISRAFHPLVRSCHGLGRTGKKHSSFGLSG
jgi:hypothetical protein